MKKTLPAPEQKVQKALETDSKLLEFLRDAGITNANSDWVHTHFENLDLELLIQLMDTDTSDKDRLELLVDTFTLSDEQAEKVMAHYLHGYSRAVSPDIRDKKLQKQHVAFHVSDEHREAKKTSTINATRRGVPEEALNHLKHILGVQPSTTRLESLNNLLKEYKILHDTHVGKVKNRPLSSEVAKDVLEKLRQVDPYRLMLVKSKFEKYTFQFEDLEIDIREEIEKEKQNLDKIQRAYEYAYEHYKPTQTKKPEPKELAARLAVAIYDVEQLRQTLEMRNLPPMRRCFRD